MAFVLIQEGKYYTQIFKKWDQQDNENGVLCLREQMSLQKIVCQAEFVSFVRFIW